MEAKVSNIKYLGRNVGLLLQNLLDIRVSDWDSTAKNVLSGAGDISLALFIIVAGTVFANIHV